MENNCSIQDSLQKDKLINDCKDFKQKQALIIDVLFWTEFFRTKFTIDHTSSWHKLLIVNGHNLTLGKYRSSKYDI
jgi:hypothetical protein